MECCMVLICLIVLLADFRLADSHKYVSLINCKKTSGRPLRNTLKYFISK